MDKLESLMKKIEKFRELAKEIVSNACYGALLAKGFIVDETQVEPGFSMSYTPQHSFKFAFCRQKERSRQRSENFIHRTSKQKEVLS